jgi:hypothetical protein
MACSPYTSQSWRWMSVSFMFLRPPFTCGGLLDSLEHFKHRRRCVNVVRLSANSVRAFQKNQQTLHARVPWWPQGCWGNICKWNLFCGYAS